MIQKNNYTFKIRPSVSNGKNNESIKVNHECSKKTGRPLKNINNCKIKFVKVYCTEEDFLEFQKYCEEQKNSGSEILYKFLKRLIRKKNISS